MNDMRPGLALTATLPLLLLAAGCAKTAPTLTTTRPQPDTQPGAPDGSVRVRELSRLSEEYGALSRQLPGRTAADHQELMRQVFAELGQILPLFADPRNNLVFRQQLGIIDESRAQLASGSTDLSTEPAIATGLHAAQRALAGIAQNGYFDQADLKPLIDQMAAKVDELDTVRGLTHPVVVGEAVELSNGIISKMSDALAQRIDGETTSAAPNTQTAPTTQPAPSESPAATAPATAPASAPAADPSAPAEPPKN